MSAIFAITLALALAVAFMGGVVLGFEVGRKPRNRVKPKEKEPSEENKPQSVHILNVNQQITK